LKLNCRHVTVVFLLIAVSTFLAYSSVSTFEFNDYDDVLYVTGNDLVKRGITAEGVATAFIKPMAANWHPVTMISHMLDVELFGMNAGAHHLINVCFHLANSLQLFWVLLKMTRQLWPSAAVALLFAVHPLHVESVAWVAERKDVLSGFFAVLTLWAYARYAARARVLDYLLVLFFFTVGLLSKPMLVTLPVLLLFLDYWPLSRLPFSPETSESFPRQPFRRVLLEKIPLLLLVLASSVATIVAQSRVGAIAPLGHFPLSVRLANAIVSYVRYLSKMLWPADLSFHYEHPGLWPLPIVIAALLFLMILSCAAITSSRRFPWLSVGWLWFLTSLVPVIGLVQVGGQAMADRYMYLPLIGPSIIAVWSLQQLVLRRSDLRFAISSVTFIAGLTLMFLTRAQVQHWRTSETLYAHGLRLNWNSATAHRLLARTLSTRGDQAGAVRHYSEALRVLPHDELLHYNLGIVLMQVGDPVRATNHLATSLQLCPTNTSTRYHLAHALALLGDTPGAISNYTAVLQGAPQDYDTRIQLGYTYLSQNDLAPALEQFHEALRLAPHSPAARHALGVGLLQAGKTDEAISHFRDALKLAPALAPAHRDLGRALARGGDPTGAIASFREAIRLRPSFAEALNDLAWLLATHPDASIRNGTEALQLATQACALSGYQQPVPLTTLAAAHAELGQFDQAARTAERALALSGNSTGLQTHKVLEAAKRNGAYRGGPDEQ